MIRWRRSHFAALDRPGLEAHACERHGVVKREMARRVAAAV